MAPIQRQRNRKNVKTTSETASQAKKRKKSFKNQLRDVQRLLRQKDIPATVRVAQERMLTMIKDNLSESTKQQKEKKLAKKYKMVKFFERRKITRMFKSCSNDMTQCCNQQQREELDNQLKLLKQQWNYVQYFPKDEKYISLFPPTPCTNEHTLKRQDEIFKLINDKVDKEELEDASSMILQSPKEKKNMKQKSLNKKIRLSDRKDENKGGDEQATSQHSLVDDFFIDTKPSEIITSQDDSERQATDGNSQEETSSTVTTTDKGHGQHKLKRLKGERELAAAKKVKKNKKSKD